MVEHLVVEVLISLDTGDRRALLVPCPAMLDVPYEPAEHVSWLVHARRRERNSPWWKPGCFKQVLPALAHLRKNETFVRLGAGFGVSPATAWRYGGGGFGRPGLVGTGPARGPDRPG